MTRSVGLDGSLTRFGVCWWDETNRRPTWPIKAWSTPANTDDLDRCEEQGERLGNLLVEIKPLAVVIEAPSHASKWRTHQSGMLRYEMLRVVRETCPGALLVHVSPNQRAILAGCPGNASKGAVRFAVKSMVPDVPNHDVADALALMSAGLWFSPISPAPPLGEWTAKQVDLLGRLQTETVRPLRERTYQ